MPTNVALEPDEMELFQSVRAIKAHGWGEVHSVITAKKITMVNETKTKKI